MELTRPWKVIGHALLTLASIAVLVPMALVVLAAFKPHNEIFSSVPWPQNPTLGNFVALFRDMPFGQYLWNTAGTTVLRVGGQIVIAILTAYGFARWQFRGRDVAFALVLGAMMIPHQLTMIPIYIMMGEFGWFDSWTALVVPNLAMPFAVFLLRQHFLAFPGELYDAAEMDGAGHWRALWLVVVPNLGPALSALVVVLFIDCWNEYFWPLLVTDSDHARTLQVGIRQYLQEEMADAYGPLMAGVTLVSLPALAVFFAFQRRVMDTFVSSGLKG